jgi:hypothetical protein
MLHNITEYCPRGTQIKRPGGFRFKPECVIGLEADDCSYDEPSLKVKLEGGSETIVTFHRNVDDGPPDVFAILRNIEEAVNASA